MANLNDVRSFLTDEHGLAVVSTTQRDGRVLSSVINCGVTEHPVTGAVMIGLVSRGDAMRNVHVRRGSEVTIAVRRGWQWAGVTGAASLIGLDDPADGYDDERIRVLLRDVFQEAGGTHDDWDEYDRVMKADRRVAMFIEPTRILGNRP